MVTYVLDSSAVLRYLHNQAGSERVAEILAELVAGTSDAIICAAHWGEIAGITCKLYGRSQMENVLAQVTSLGVRVVAADGARSVRAALIRLNRKIPYVDAFGVELAQGEDRVLVTAEFDFKVARRDVKIEFLPAK